MQKNQIIEIEKTFFHSPTNEPPSHDNHLRHLITSPAAVYLLSKSHFIHSIEVPACRELSFRQTRNFSQKQKKVMFLSFYKTFVKYKLHNFLIEFFMFL